MQYTINYRLTIDNGELVDEAQNFTFTAGDGQLAPMLENCITQASTKHLQTILLQGADIFGEYDDRAITEIDKNELPDGYKVNSAIDFNLPSGEKVIGVVKKIQTKTATIDFNHPLINCNLAFNFEILTNK